MSHSPLLIAMQIDASTEAIWMCRAISGLLNYSRSKLTKKHARECISLASFKFPNEYKKFKCYINNCVHSLIHTFITKHKQRFELCSCNGQLRKRVLFASGLRNIFATSDARDRASITRTIAITHYAFRGWTKLGMSPCRESTFPKHLANGKSRRIEQP